MDGFISASLAKIKGIIISVDKLVEKLEDLYITGGMSDGAATLENSLEVFKSVKYRADPAIYP